MSSYNQQDLKSGTLTSSRFNSGKAKRARGNRVPTFKKTAQSNVPEEIQDRSNSLKYNRDIKKNNVLTHL